MKPVICFLVVLAASSMWSCRTQKVVVSEKETTTIAVHERDIPVFTPQVDVNAVGKIVVGANGFPRLDGIDVTTNSDKPLDKQPKVSVELDSLGNLKVNVVIPEDSVNVSVADTTKYTERETNNYIEVEKENPWWKKVLMCVGFFAVIVIIVILARITKVFK